MTSLHELAIKRVIARHEPLEVHTGKLGRFMRALSKKHEMEFGESWGFSRRPDAWAYEPWAGEGFVPGTLTLFEIEDSHPIDLEKMRDLADFAWDCDNYYLDVKLKVYDRYGENEREVDLIDYFFMFIVEDAKNKPRRADAAAYDKVFLEVLDRMQIK